MTAKSFIHTTFSKDGYTIDESGMDEIYELVEKSSIAPAFMAEITESVKSHMILVENNIVKANYIKNSVHAYLRQVELSRKKDMSETNDMKLAHSLKDTISGEVLKELLPFIKQVKERLDIED